MRRKEIMLTCKLSPRRVQATIFGTFAVHKAVPTDVNGVGYFPAPDSWSVTHVPTGLSVGCFALELEREDAVSIAKALDDSREFGREFTGATSSDGRWIMEAVVAAALETVS